MEGAEEKCRMSDEEDKKTPLANEDARGVLSNIMLG